MRIQRLNGVKTHLWPLVSYHLCNDLDSGLYNLSYCFFYSRNNQVALCTPDEEFYVNYKNFVHSEHETAWMSFYVMFIQTFQWDILRHYNLDTNIINYGKKWGKELYKVSVYWKQIVISISTHSYIQGLCSNYESELCRIGVSAENTEAILN